MSGNRRSRNQGVPASPQVPFPGVPSPDDFDSIMNEGESVKTSTTFLDINDLYTIKRVLTAGEGVEYFLLTAAHDGMGKAKVQIQSPAIIAMVDQLKEAHRLLETVTDTLEPMYQARRIKEMNDVLTGDNDEENAQDAGGSSL